VQYGIIGTGGFVNPNDGIQKQGLIQNSVVFTLPGLPSGFNVDTDIGNVFFQYGTALSEPRFPGHQAAPEPSTIPSRSEGNSTLCESSFRVFCHSVAIVSSHGGSDCRACQCSARAIELYV
jgi:hypothetical protein